MPINKISQAAVDAVFARLSDTATGFNVTIAAACAAYAVPSFFTLNFSGTSQNFFLGQLDPDELEQSSPFKYPMACLYSIESQSTQIQKFNKFSGAVRAVLDCYVTWKSAKVIQNFDRYASIVEDTIVDVINRERNQNWPYPVVYNGNLHVKKGPVRFAGENFRQQIAGAMDFEVHRTA